jgi:hypothetical protein
VPRRIETRASTMTPYEVLSPRADPPFQVQLSRRAVQMFDCADFDSLLGTFPFMGMTRIVRSRYQTPFTDEGISWLFSIKTNSLWYMDQFL